MVCQLTKQLLSWIPVPLLKQCGQRLAAVLTPSKRKYPSLPLLAQGILFRLRYQYISEKEKNEWVSLNYRKQPAVIHIKITFTPDEKIPDSRPVWKIKVNFTERKALLVLLLQSFCCLHLDKSMNRYIKAQAVQRKGNNFPTERHCLENWVAFQTVLRYKYTSNKKKKIVECLVSKHSDYIPDIPVSKDHHNPLMTRDSTAEPVNTGHLIGTRFHNDV